MSNERYEDEPVGQEVTGQFVSALAFDTHLYQGGDGVFRTTMEIEIFTMNGNYAKVEIPTEIVIGLMQGIAEHMAIIFPRKVSISDAEMNDDALHRMIEDTETGDSDGKG